jgi:hypothetical protein
MEFVMTLAIDHHTPSAVEGNLEANAAPVVTLHRVTAVMLVVPGLPQLDPVDTVLVAVEVADVQIRLRLRSSHAGQAAEVVIHVPRTKAFELALATAAWQGRLLLGREKPQDATINDQAFDILALELGEGPVSVGDTLLRLLRVPVVA